MFYEELKTLCTLNGISGRETPVSDYILERCREYGAEAYRDNLGNVIAFKKGKRAPKHKLMLCAHTDEVGAIVTGITKDGMLRIATVGGINPRVLVGHRVTVGDAFLPGVIGSKSIHHMTQE